MREQSSPNKYVRPNFLLPSLITAPNNSKSSDVLLGKAAALKAKITQDQKVAAALAATKKNNAKIVSDAKKKEQRVKDNGGSKNPDGNTSSLSALGDYFYNIPMVKSNYFSETDRQRLSLVSNKSGNFGDGANAWSEVGGAKGVIQMNKANVKNYANSADTSNANTDNTLYGFKFLYNPNEVNMGWGLAEGMNWEGLAVGADGNGNPFTMGLQYSKISFSLLLNRVADMAVLDKNGLKPGIENPYPDAFRVAPNSNRQKEFSLIYEKGTMYDLEYLFRTLMGINATRTFNVMGTTADRGWLQGTSVELHLGNSLRYLVRISSLEVKHALFNDRMVPTLSYVNIECSRFNEML